MKKHWRHLIAACALLMPMLSHASEEGPELDKAPINIQDTESIQRGARLFTNYCLSCHSAIGMRFNRLEDVGLSEQQIKDNLMFTTDKIGNTMAIAMDKADAKKWFGAAPPDLSVIARSRGADWLYTYLRSFYRDPSRPTGWNNTVFDKVGMPHVLWQMQGEQELKVEKDKEGHEVKSLVLTKPGTMTKIVEGHAVTAEYDQRVADLVNYLVFMGEPAQVTRYQIGYVVLLFLGLILLPLAYFLKKEYWKDIH